MKTHVVALAGLLAVCAAGAAEEKKGKTPIYKSPQAAFDAWVAAMKKGDFQGMADCMSPEMHRHAAAQLAAGALGLRAAAGDDDAGKKFREKYKTLFAALDGHGLGPEATKAIKVNNTPEGRAKATAEIAALIKQPKALLVALQGAYVKTGLIKGAGVDLDLKLKDVKVTGDRAAGVMVGKAGKKEGKVPQHFVKAGGGWLLTVPPAGGKAGS